MSTETESLQKSLNFVTSKVFKLERASISIMSALIQLQAITSSMRFKTAVSADPEIQAEFDEMNKRVERALASLNEAVDVDIE